MLHDIPSLPPALGVAKLLEELKGSVDKLHVAVLMRELSRIVRRSAELEGDATLVVDVTLQHALSKYPYASEVAVPVCEIFRHYALIPTMRIFFIETAVDAPYISVLIRLASGNMAFPHKADARLVTEVVAFLANLSSGSTHCDIGTWTTLDFGARDLARRALKVFPADLAVHEQCNRLLKVSSMSMTSRAPSRLIRG
ncbi:elongation factor EF-G [Perkinsus olseni]|uniref:Elongation factor EF-G n=1 Tax=Perkinsus olseni TaxID=32597 RepID=A0A7J6QWN5_PEROL|nr:elongation factor EF-G [Perkinsus olseni]